MPAVINLVPMTLALCHTLYRGWQNDPAICADPARFRPFRYDPEWVDRYFARQQTPDRRYFAILAGGTVVGEIILKRIDRAAGTCALSIHLQNDSVKNKGYGTRAEKLAVAYAFDRLGLRAVLADAVKGNARSRHVLEKVGFKPCGEDETFACYRIEKPEP